MSDETVNLIYGQRLDKRITELRYEFQEKKSNIDFNIHRVQSMNLNDERFKENLVSILKLVENVGEAISIGEKILTFTKDQKYKKWSEKTYPSQQLAAMRMSDEVGILVIKQTSKNLTAHLKNFNNNQQ